jgi:transcriptional regulator with XRE-family HTH domain
MAFELLGASRRIARRSGTMHTELIRSPFSAFTDSSADEESFGARLRAERERRRVSIAAIAESTKILGALLEGLENDDVSRWPTGLYRRAFIRAYARAIGLDPEPIVREFVTRFPEPEETTAVSAPQTATIAPPRAVLRLTLADSGPAFRGGELLREAGRRLVAIAADAAVLGAIGAALYTVVGAFWAPLTIAIVGYYFGSILVLGNTPGVCLVASRATGDSSSGLLTNARQRFASRWAGAAALANRWRSTSSQLWHTWLEK